MSEVRIPDLPRATSVNNQDLLLIEQSTGTKAVSVSSLSEGLDVGNATTFAGHSINEFYLRGQTYSKSEVDTRLNNKSDKSDTYTKAEVDVKIDNVIGGGVGTNVAYGTVVAVGNWTMDNTTKLYYVNVTHGLETKRFVPTVICNDSNDSVEAVYKVIDDNTVRFFNEVGLNATITIINGNATTELVYAKIDDVNISTSRAWSSTKTNTEIGKKANSQHTHSIRDITDFTSNATDVKYSNASSGLTATNAQSAIDELASEINGQRVKLVNSMNGIIGLL